MATTSNYTDQQLENARSKLWRLLPAEQRAFVYVEPTGRPLVYRFYALVGGLALYNISPLVAALLNLSQPDDQHSAHVGAHYMAENAVRELARVIHHDPDALRMERVPTLRVEQCNA